MIKNKKQMFIIISSFLVVLMLFTTTYAFFNYTRTGVANVIKTGRISFSTSQSSGHSEAINLTNIVPISRSELETDVNNSAEVVIDITGDTTYSDGLEYLVTFEDVNIETATGKKMPIGIEITPEKTGELGISNTNYFNSSNDGGRGGNTSYYKVLANNVIRDGDYVLVGYIRPGVAEVNGTVGIKVFIDKDGILISDTYDGTESDNMGTPRSKAQGKVVLTTEEWNSLQGNKGVSFKIKIQANEGVWVGNPTSRNDMVNIYSSNIFTSEQKSSITEINFIRMSEEMINTHANLIDLTADGGQGVVKAWRDGTKLYVVSPGETYFPADSSAMFSGFSNLQKINFENINTSNVTSMEAMFIGCSSLTTIDLSDFGSSNLTTIGGIFSGCTDLVSINMSNFKFGNVTSLSGFFYNFTNLQVVDLHDANAINVLDMGGMFQKCTSLTNVNMNGMNTSHVTYMGGMFSECTNLTIVDLKNINTSSVTGMNGMFSNCTSLTTLDLSSFDTSNVTSMEAMFAMANTSSTIWTPNNNNLTSIIVGSGWNTNSVTNSINMFYNNTHLVGGAGTTFDSTKTDKTMAVIDTPSTPGYLTLKTN